MREPVGKPMKGRMLENRGTVEKCANRCEPFPTAMARRWCRLPCRSMASLPSPRAFLRQLDLATLDLFALVCESGSIARAGARGQLAASAISKRIAELEALAGAPLLLRHARGVRPTPVGELVLGHVQTLLGEVERLRADLGDVAAGVRGQVRLCASASAMEQYLPADIAAFMRRHADIRIDVRQGASRAVAQAVREGEVELGICGPSDGVAGLESCPYRKERLVLVVPRGHPLAGQRAVAYAEALGEPQIGLRDSSTVQQALDREARAVQRTPGRRIEVDSLSAMCRMVECGLGLGVMPEGAFKAMGVGRRLAALRLTDGWAARSLDLYALRFDALPAAAQRFVDELAPAPRA